MKQIIADESLVAKCGLYCGACGRYLNDKCPGCAQNEKAAKWCGVRTCNIEKGIATCAECKENAVDTCREYNSVMAKIFGFIFRSNRRACIERIRVVGPAAFAKEMSEKRAATLPR